MIRLTKRATRGKFKHLPSFMDILRTDDALVVKTSSYPHSLKHLILNRKFMERKGWLIIHGLLEAYLELKRMRISLRNIIPANIFLSDDATKLVLNGLHHVIWEGEPRHTKPTTAMPYSNRELQ